MNDEIKQPLFELAQERAEVRVLLARAIDIMLTDDEVNSVV
jgi:hypothetical protein